MDMNELKRRAASQMDGLPELNPAYWLDVVDIDEENNIWMRFVAKGDSEEALIIILTDKYELRYFPDYSIDVMCDKSDYVTHIFEDEKDFFEQIKKY
tara:strand:- start:1702 stop:1992 length:291 start_codon:yes stop_codon:yes gene_type:complete